MINKTCWCIIIILIAHSCQEGNDTYRFISVSEVHENLDLISMELDADLMDYYPHWTISEDNHLVCWNHLLHKIDVFDIKARTFSHSVQLNKGGPNDVRPFRYALKTGDQYFLIGNGYFLYRVSANGEVISKIPLDEVTFAKEEYLPWQKKGMGLRNFDVINMDYTAQSFFQPLYKYDNDEIDYDAYFMCRIDINSWNSKLIKISYPKNYVSEIQRTSPLRDGSMIGVGSSLIFNFPGLNQIFRYDTVTQKIEVFEPTISNISEMKVTFSEFKNGFGAQRRAPRYLAIKYDPTYNLFYRMHKTSKGREDGSKANYFLIAMDRNFNTLVEYELGSKFSPTYGISHGDLYFSENIPSGEWNFNLYRLNGSSL